MGLEEHRAGEKADRSSPVRTGRSSPAVPVPFAGQRTPGFNRQGEQRHQARPPRHPRLRPARAHRLLPTRVLAAAIGGADAKRPGPDPRSARGPSIRHAALEGVPESP